MIFPNMEITNEGVSLLGQVASAAGTLVITKVKIGSGTYSGDIKLLTDLITAFHEFTVNSVQAQPDSSIKVAAYFDNVGFLASHEWREIGVYAQLGGSPATEILYSYTNGGVNFDYIPSEAEAPYRHTLDVRNYISDVTSVSFLITELTDKYDFNTHSEMIAATYLIDGDRINLWGETSQNDGVIEKRVIKIANGKDGVLLTNGLYANLLEFDFREEINLNVGGQKENYENMQDVSLSVDEVYIDSNTGIKYKCYTATTALPSPNPDYVTEITNSNLQKQIENLLGWTKIADRIFSNLEITQNYSEVKIQIHFYSASGIAGQVILGSTENEFYSAYSSTALEGTVEKTNNLIEMTARGTNLDSVYSVLIR